MSEEVYRNKIYVSSPTSISIGHITWFALDTKLVGRIKKLINDCEKKDKEIKRLNNIIDELEKEFEWQLKKQIDIDKFAEEQGFLNYNPVKLMVEHFKNKLKELKEGK